jgi:hypothetical protein
MLAFDQTILLLANEGTSPEDIAEAMMKSLARLIAARRPVPKHQKNEVKRLLRVLAAEMEKLPSR